MGASGNRHQQGQRERERERERERRVSHAGITTHSSYKTATPWHYFLAQLRVTKHPTWNVHTVLVVPNITDVTLSHISSPSTSGMQQQQQRCTSRVCLMPSLTNYRKAWEMAVFQAFQQVLPDWTVIISGFARIITATNVIGKGYSHQPTVRAIWLIPDIHGSDHKLWGRAEYEASNDTDGVAGHRRKHAVIHVDHTIVTTHIWNGAPVATFNM